MEQRTNRFSAQADQGGSRPPVQPSHWHDMSMQQKCDWLNLQPYYVDRKRHWRTNGHEAWSEAVSGQRYDQAA